MNKAKMIDAIEFKLLNPTATQAQVAEIIGITDRQLRNWENDAKDKSGWNGLNKEYADKAFGKHALPAIATLVFLSKYAKSEMVRMQSAQDILDRAGYKPTDKQEIEHSGTVVFANESDIPD
ncbi:hypothetical protein [Streptococcus suis]